MFIEKINFKDLINIFVLMVGLLFIRFFGESIILHEVLVIVWVGVYALLTKKIKFSLINLFFFFEFLMPPVPTSLSLSPILFVLFGLLLFVDVVVSNRQVRIHVNKTIYLLVGSIIFIVILALYSIVFKQNNYLQFIISMVPYFMYIYMLIVVDNGIRNKKFSFTELLNAVYIWGMLYVVNNFSLFIFNLLIGKNISYRITLYDFNTLSPVPLLLLSLTAMIYNKYKSPYILTLLLLIYTSTLLPLTRSYILASSIVMLLVFLNQLKTFNLVRSILILFSTVALGWIIWISNILAPVINRFKYAFTGDKNVSQRFDEYSIAIDAFKNNPIFGIGIGADFSERHGEMVNYIHNFFFYIMANMGSIGLIVLTVIAIIFSYKWLVIKDVYIRGLLLGGVIILFYSFFFAIFKWFSFGMIAGILFWTIFSEKLIQKEISDKGCSNET